MRQGEQRLAGDRLHALAVVDDLQTETLGQYLVEEAIGVGKALDRELHEDGQRAFARQYRGHAVPDILLIPLDIHLDEVGVERFGDRVQPPDGDGRQATGRRHRPPAARLIGAHFHDDLTRFRTQRAVIDGSEAAEAVDLDALAQPRNQIVVGLERQHPPFGAGQVGEQQGEIAEVRADIEHGRAARHHAQHRLGHPHFPIALQQQMAGDADVAGVDIHFVAAEDAAQRAVIAQIDRAAQAADFRFNIFARVTQDAPDVVNRQRLGHAVFSLRVRRHAAMRPPTVARAATAPSCASRATSCSTVQGWPVSGSA